MSREALKGARNESSFRQISVIGQDRFFTLDEANEILPVIRRITEEVSRLTEPLLERLERMNPAETEKTTVVEEQVNELIIGWRQKIKKLGAIPRGSWFVDFATLDGFYSWKFPESVVSFWHDTNETFSQRTPIKSRTIN